MRLLIALLLLPSLAAQAQVATDTQSLDALQPTAPAPKPQTGPVHRATHGPAKPRAATPARRRPLAPVAMPAAPPANPVLVPPPMVVPTRAPAPPPDVHVVAGAWGDATPIAGGTRLSFGAGSADLNPKTQAALIALAERAKANPAMIIAVTAWAPGTQDDPSTPRRLSLDRALAARAVLIKQGIVSARIRTIAKGTADPGPAPLDRADVTELPPPK